MRSRWTVEKQNQLNELKLMAVMLILTVFVAWIQLGH